MSLDVQLSYYLVLDYQISSEEYPSELGYWLQLGFRHVAACCKPRTLLGLKTYKVYAVT